MVVCSQRPPLDSPPSTVRNPHARWATHASPAASPACVVVGEFSPACQTPLSAAGSGENNDPPPGAKRIMIPSRGEENNDSPRGKVHRRDRMMMMMMMGVPDVASCRLSSRRGSAPCWGTVGCSHLILLVAPHAIERRLGQATLMRRNEVDAAQPFQMTLPAVLPHGVGRRVELFAAGEPAAEAARPGRRCTCALGKAHARSVRRGNRQRDVCGLGGSVADSQ